MDWAVAPAIITLGNPGPQETMLPITQACLLQFELAAREARRVWESAAQGY